MKKDYVAVIISLLILISVMFFSFNINDTISGNAVAEQTEVKEYITWLETRPDLETMSSYGKQNRYADYLYGIVKNIDSQTYENKFEWAEAVGCKNANIKPYSNFNDERIRSCLNLLEEYTKELTSEANEQNNTNITEQPINENKTTEPITNKENSSQTENNNNTQTNTTKTITACMDSDEKNIYSKGYIIINYSDNSYTKLYDKCSSSNKVLERICSTDSKAAEYTCDNGCENGACIIKTDENNNTDSNTTTIKQISCTDSDGLDFDNKGYITVKYSNGDSIVLTDNCNGANTQVKENYCYKINGVSVSGQMVKTCANKCSNGACIVTSSGNNTGTGSNLNKSYERNPKKPVEGTKVNESQYNNINKSKETTSLISRLLSLFK